MTAVYPPEHPVDLMDDLDQDLLAELMALEEMASGGPPVKPKKQKKQPVVEKPRPAPTPAPRAPAPTPPAATTAAARQGSVTFHKSSAPPSGRGAEAAPARAVVAAAVQETPEQLEQQLFGDDELPTTVGGFAKEDEDEVSCYDTVSISSGFSDSESPKTSQDDEESGDMTEVSQSHQGSVLCLARDNNKDGDDELSFDLRKFVKSTESKTLKGVDRTIAELFPEATIMFADIAGFTAWSSIRDAGQVFTLLESIFQAFDRIAHKDGVFKVETVGDCYVAACGVPERNEDHATIIAKFARKCVDKFTEVVRSLEMKLGPDTSELGIRIGINSGPVTAGVLRGDRARFQLFGDTVNTAARIESTGVRDRIHLSEKTATLIQEAGFPDWVLPRDEVVTAKGKGRMNTFWLNHVEAKVSNCLNMDKITGSMFKDRIPGSGWSTPSKTENSLERRIQRCIDWNSELLLSLLKNVVSHRQTVYGPNRVLSKGGSAKLKEIAGRIGKGFLVVDEVANIIELPETDSDDRSYTTCPDKIKLRPEVSAQCRAYVALLASLYRGNPFHNFEHASHVTMSVHKLLSRIVAPKRRKGEPQTNDELNHDHTYGITSDPLTQFSVVLSALIHDVDHRGVSNNLLVKEDQYLGATYQNKSVAEQNSVDIAWDALLLDQFEDFRNCIFGDVKELQRFRQLVVNSVIATDIFDKEQSALRKNRWATAFSADHTDSTRTDINRKATIVIEHMIQASDVSHTMQHWHVYQKWNERLFQEMYEAFLDKRSDKDPSEGWYKGELWFFDNYVIPLAKKLKNCGVFGVSSDEYLNYAVTNRMEWASKGEDIVEKLKVKYSRVEEDDEEKED